MKFIRAGVVLLLLLYGPTGAQTHSQNQSAPWKQRYTIAEYNAYQRAASEKSPDKQIELLDAFVSQYPNSPLLIFVYPLYYNGYAQLRNFPKVFEYADRLIALGDKAPAVAHFAALCSWTAAYNNSNSPDIILAAKARDRALTGLILIPSLEHPDGMDKKRLRQKRNGERCIFI
jgi:hypothetical protein